MWIADGWKDYEVIDTSCGEKLERWGDYLLVRPDPQVIWDTPKVNKGWKHMNGHYHRSKEGGGEWEFFDLPEQWDIHYKGLTFNLKPFSFKHTGLFPEQAVNWDWFGNKIRNAGRPVKVLNLFAYTGGATLAAVFGGIAHISHLDNRCRNFAPVISGHRVCFSDILLWGLQVHPYQLFLVSCLQWEFLCFISALISETST